MPVLNCQTLQDGQQVINVAQEMGFLINFISHAETNLPLDQLELNTAEAIHKQPHKYTAQSFSGLEFQISEWQGTYGRLS